MNVAETSLKPQRANSPRAAAVAGILFALLYGLSVVLIRLSIPAEASTESSDWLTANARIIGLALNLAPFAGIAFLYFIGVIRDKLGDVEDRLFATVFLGSGLLFMAMTLVGTALAGGLLSSYAVEPEAILASGLFTFSREVMFNVINVYAIRMAGVCMISLAIVWLRSRVMHRAWGIVTIALALVLLISISFSLWVILIFPAWVLVVSVYFLFLPARSQPGRAVSEPGT